MRLITVQTQLEKEFIRLVKQYDKFYWATAWAGINSNPFDELKNHPEKIKRLIVGIHFYQTHPEFIAHFLKHRDVRYILQPAGTFHPKIYLFENNKNDWELLVGSGNFTSGAFNTNKEATLLVSPDDIDSATILSDTKA
jgi:HKD family nuclease